MLGTSSTKITLYDWLQIVSAMLEDGLQLKWKYYWSKEAKALEHQDRIKGFEASKNEILGEGLYTD